MFGVEQFGGTLFGHIEGAGVFVAAPLCRSFVVLAENRFDIIMAENRFDDIPIENRFDIVSAEDRSVTVPAENRFQSIRCIRNRSTN